MWIKNEPHTKSDKFKGGLHGLTNSETYSNHIGLSEIKTSYKSKSWW